MVLLGLLYGLNAAGEGRFGPEERSSSRKATTPATPTPAITPMPTLRPPTGSEFAGYTRHRPVRPGRSAWYGSRLPGRPGKLHPAGPQNPNPSPARHESGVSGAELAPYLGGNRSTVGPTLGLTADRAHHLAHRAHAFAGDTQLGDGIRDQPPDLVRGHLGW